MVYKQKYNVNNVKDLAQNRGVKGFYGHNSKNHIVGVECFSQFFKAEFVINELKFSCAEQYMMYMKAKTFGEDRLANEILGLGYDPYKSKKLGRSRMANFDSKLWDSLSPKVVLDGNIAKFSQNPDILRVLANTGQTILVEATNNDFIWGNGLHISDSKLSKPTEWKGLNQLGFALMEVRDLLT